MATTPLRKIEAEISRLRSLYLTAVYSFEQSGTAIIRDLKTGAVDPKAPVYSKSEDQPVAASAYVFLHRIKSQFPRYLRETIFVRLISALEVFLIDVVRELFLARRDLFHSEHRIEFSFGEILAVNSITDLWAKLINRDLRKLQAQGLKEIVKFYRNRFNIDLAGSRIPLNSIQELHDRRHILVHRLGTADDEYRRRYEAAQKHLTVPEPYLLDSFNAMLEFARFVHSAAQLKIEEGKGRSAAQRGETEVRVIVEPLGSEAEPVIDRDFHYSIGDGIGCLGDILASFHAEGGKRTLILSGTRASVKAYLKILQGVERRGQLLICEKETIRRAAGRTPVCRLPAETIELIAKSLPKRPWPKHIHKEIAQKVGVSNGQASAAITIILRDEKFTSLLVPVDEQPNTGMQTDAQKNRAADA